MIDILDIFNISATSLALLCTCPIIAACASFVRAMASEVNLKRLPEANANSSENSEPDSTQNKTSYGKRIYALFVMIVTGGLVGLGIAFLFLDGVQPQTASAGRIWFITLVAGFATPSIAPHLLKGVDQILKSRNAS